MMINVLLLSQLGCFIILLTLLQMMNMTARNFAYDNFAQSATDLYPRKNRLMGSTGLTNMNSSMHMTNTRLPQLSRSYSGSKSAKLKLTTIQATLSSMAQQLHQLKLQTRDSRRLCNYLKDELGENQLGTLNLELMGQANKLEKTFKLAKKYDQDRTLALKKDCDSLRQSTINIRNLCSQIQSKMDNLENVMGIYSGKEKHKI